MALQLTGTDEPLLLSFILYYFMVVMRNEGGIRNANKKKSVSVGGKQACKKNIYPSIFL